MGSKLVLTLRGVVPGIFLCALVFVSARSAVGVQTIALRGVNPSGTEAAAFQSFSLPSLNNRGQVAFAAQVAGNAVTTANDTGYWIADGGAFHPVVREGASAPGLSAGGVFGAITSLSTAQVPLNDAGDIAVGMFATPSSGIWIGNEQSLTLLAAQGNAAPGAANSAPFDGLGSTRLTLNRSGDVAFYANLSAAPYTTINSLNYSDGLWILNRSGPVASVLAGKSVPEIAPEAQLYGFRTFTYAPLNRNAQVALDAQYKIAPAASAILPSTWLASADELELRAYNGQPLPEIGPNVKLGFTLPAGISSSGAIAVHTTISNTGTSTATAVLDAAGIEFAARLGQPAPGTNGRVFRETFYDPTISSRGDVAFYGNAFVDGTNDYKTGIWAGPADDLKLVVLEGMPAPGTNATFGSFFRNTPAINRFGQIAVPATLSDTPPGANSSSLWATDIDGNLVMIGRTGGTLEVAPGDVRTISSLSMLTHHGDDDGRPRGLNDLGQLAFSANFSDGTNGIFVSNAVSHLPGDFNGDHVVDTADYIVWRRALATQDPIGDGDRNGVVDERDRELWREFYGATLPNDAGMSAGANVPEPAAILLTSFMSTVLLARRRRSC